MYLKSLLSHSLGFPPREADTYASHKKGPMGCIPGVSDGGIRVSNQKYD